MKYRIAFLLFASAPPAAATGNERAPDAAR